MRRGLGGIYLRGKTYWIHFSVRGRVVRRSADTEDKEEALNTLMAERIRHGLSVPKKTLTIDGLKELLADNYRLTQRRTAKNALRCMDRVKEFFGPTVAAEITSSRLSAYARVRQEEGAAPATFQYELAILRRAMTLAHRADLIDRVPAFPSITINNVRAGFLEDDAFWEIHSHLHPRSKPVVEFLYWTGWRRSDALALEWRQVDLNRGTILLERGLTKNRAGRLLPYRALPELGAVIDSQPKIGTRVFPISRSTLWQDWDNARRKALHPGAFLHDLRRGAARRYARKGVNEKLAMQLLGMKTTAIFHRYLIQDETDMASALRRMSPGDSSQESHKQKQRSTRKADKKKR
jgi:integrase